MRKLIDLMIMIPENWKISRAFSIWRKWNGKKVRREYRKGFFLNCFLMMVDTRSQLLLNYVGNLSLGRIAFWELVVDESHKSQRDAYFSLLKLFSVMQRNVLL